MIRVKLELESRGSLIRLFEAMEWCEDRFGASKQDRLGRWIGGRWCVDRGFIWTFNFTNNEDATLFVLRWS